MFAARPGRSDLSTHGPTMPVVVVGPRGRVETRALIDTGSVTSSIDVDILNQVGAPQIGSTPIQTISGISNVPLYQARIETADGQVLLEGHAETLGDQLPENSQVLIGRDALANQHFSYDGGGVWSMSAHDACMCRPSVLTIAGAVVMGHVISAGAAWLFRSLSRSTARNRNTR